ncbi:fumarylacetoacetate hydrolase family protein [Williamsia deligens]|uniref:Fumarylacetoacetate hydrolase family protein n=1 Tax=Williamsia deligens TaxID=321325 RepID=A0ABW3GFU3_9NOCA|nr:fumarylacetoacetate hydrolase family protein [Williamsia deligens]MCP2195158.1 2-keto-4-pentenoate hydratase/2-oxohepta-3-ene-1,7-dioic acid hydratase (catechol pathway) [Williamsia deligens]
MRVRRIEDGGRSAVAVAHESGAWVDLDSAAAMFGHDRRGPLTRDVLSFLGARERGRELAADLADRAVAEGVALVEPGHRLSFDARSLRCFMGWEQHWTQAAHSLVRRNLPAAMPFIRGVEVVTRRTFPALRPGAAYDDHPVYYTGNHRTIRAHGQPLPWPDYTDLLDYELEFGVVVDRPLRDATESEATSAIAGFVVFNDVSARDTQWDEQRRSPFGPVVKTKTFASSMGSEIVTPDVVLPVIDALEGRVEVNGQTWATTSTAGLRYGPGECIAYASRGEDIGVGELFTSGTLPSGSGLEIDRWIGAGDEVTLTLERIGSVSNPVGHKGAAAGPA